MERRVILAEDSKNINYHIWMAENPKGIVNFNHGMIEHSLRYEYMAKRLSEKGYIVVAQDHRGHGINIKEGDIKGYFSDEKGYEKVCSDAYEVALATKEEYPRLPVFIFGFSMGSFIARILMANHSSFYSGAIIMGSSAKQNLLLTKVGALLSKIGNKLNKEKPNKLLQKTAFLGFNKGFENRTPCDWISRDPKAADDYLNDELCGFACTSSFYNDLIHLLSLANDKDELKKTRKDIPILIASGSADPVAKVGKGIKSVYDFYKEQGFTNVELKLYEDARHSLLHEINKDEVIDDVIRFLDKNI